MLELFTVYLIFYFIFIFGNKGQIGCLDIIEH